MRKVLLLAPLALLGCSESAPNQAQEQMAAAWNTCLANYNLAPGHAYDSEACVAQVLYRYGNEARLGSMGARLDGEARKLQVAKSIDQGSVTPSEGELELHRIDALVEQQAQEERAIAGAQRRQAMGTDMMRLGAATVAAGRPYSSVTNCSALGPSFATCTTSGY